MTAEDITKHVKAKIAAGVANATINRALEVVSRCYKLANLSVPFTAGDVMLTENNTRKGFFEAAEMDAVLAKLPDDGLRDFVRFGHITGMRKGEIESLRWDSLERDGTLKLAAEDAKTGEARTVPCGDGELAAIIKRRQDARKIRTADGTIVMARFICIAATVSPSANFGRAGKVRALPRAWASGLNREGAGFMKAAFFTICAGQQYVIWSAAVSLKP